MGTTLSPSQWLNVAINVVLPIVVALVTNRLAPGGLKAVILIFLSALSGYLVSILAAWDAGVPPDLSQATFTAVIGFVVAVATHFGVWKPFHVTGSDGWVQTQVPGGFGGER